ncbi:MAG: hypothetical protein GEV10_23560 [Streptosporangiales bacterium]|nr:hypothetical protein [Streptosporangiales bacterium]
MWPEVLPTFALARPSTVDEAVDLLSDDHVPYCGGTELLLAMRAGLLRPEALVDLKRVDGLGGVATAEGRVTIGAVSTHAEIATDTTIRGSLPLVAEVERGVGNARVRAQGSIGGNLCFAEPKSDVTTVLVALGASVSLRSPTGEREVTVEDFLAGAYWTVREPDELLVGVHVPVHRDRRGVYLRYQTMERPTANVALLAEPAGQVRLVVGAVGEVPVARSYQDLDDVDADDVARSVDPIPDLTGSIEYKRHITAVYVRRAVDRLRAVLGTKTQP